MPRPYVLRATCDILQPRVRAGEYVVWHPDTGQIRAVRDLATTPGALAGLLSDGSLTPDSEPDHLAARELQQMSRQG